MKNIVIYLAVGAGALSLSLLATSLLQQANDDQSSQIELRADFSRDAVRETVVETMERFERDRLAVDDTRAGRYAASLQSEMASMRGDLSRLVDRIEVVANTELTLEADGGSAIPERERLEALVAETMLLRREQEVRERQARKAERDEARRKRARERRSSSLQKRLGLSEEQLPRVMAIYDDYEAQRRSTFQNNQGGSGKRRSSEEIRTSMRTLEDGMNQQLKSVLDPTQYEKYLKSRQRQRSFGLDDDNTRRQRSSGAGSRRARGRDR